MQVQSPQGGIGAGSVAGGVGEGKPPHPCVGSQRCAFTLRGAAVVPRAYLNLDPRGAWGCGDRQLVVSIQGRSTLVQCWEPEGNLLGPRFTSLDLADVSEPFELQIGPEVASSLFPHNL